MNIANISTIETGASTGHIGDVIIDTSTSHDAYKVMLGPERVEVLVGSVCIGSEQARKGNAFKVASKLAFASFIDDQDVVNEQIEEMKFQGELA